MLIFLVQENAVKKSVTKINEQKCNTGELFCNCLSINSQIHLQAKILTMALILIFITAVPHYQANEETFRCNRQKDMASSLQKTIFSLCLLPSLVIMFLITLPTELKSFQRDPREFVAKTSCLLQHACQTFHFLPIKQEIF